MLLGGGLVYAEYQKIHKFYVWPRKEKKNNQTNKQKKPVGFIWLNKDVTIDIYIWTNLYKDFLQPLKKNRQCHAINYMNN